MKKWAVEIQTIIQADTRREAWQIARDFCEKKMRDLATVYAVRHKALEPQELYIALNEPIRKQG